MIHKRWQDWKANSNIYKAKMQFNGKVHKLRKNNSRGNERKIKKAGHCSRMLTEPELGKKGCWSGAEVLGSFAGDARRPEGGRRAVTRPGADRRKRQSFAEFLEADRKAVSTVEAEGWAALLEAPWCSGDRR